MPGPNQDLHPKIKPQDLKRAEGGFLLSQEEDDNLRKFLQANPNFRGKLSHRFSKKEMGKEKHPDSPYNHSILITEDPDVPGKRKVWAIYKELGKGAFGSVKLAQDVTEPTSKDWDAIKRQAPNPKLKDGSPNPDYDKLVRAIGRENSILKELGELQGAVTRERSLSGKDKDVFFSVMRLGQGAALDSFIFDEGDLLRKPEVALLIPDEIQLQKNMLKLIVMAREFMREVQYIHAAEFINCDLKLPNVLFQEKNGDGKVIDQGLAKSLTEIAKTVEESAKITAQADKINKIFHEVAKKHELLADPEEDPEEDPESELDYSQMALSVLKDQDKNTLTDDEKYALDNYESIEQRRSELLEQNKIVGTPPYVAPEIWRENKYGIPSDIYALGVNCAQLLGDFVVIEGDNPAEDIVGYGFERGLWRVLKDNLNLNIPPEWQQMVSIPDGFDEVLVQDATFPPVWEEQGWKPLMEEVMTMVSPNPADRPQLAHSMDLFATQHIQLLHKLGLHTQAKFSEHENKLIAEHIKLLNQLQITDNPVEKENLKAKLDQIKELRQQVHHLVAQDPIKNEDLILLADLIIETRNTGRS